MRKNKEYSKQTELPFARVSATNSPPEPFLKWAGGKRQLLPELISRIQKLSEGFNHYHEPFIGGGALFFELWKRGALKKNTFLSDNNPNLIIAYEGLKHEVNQVIALLHEHKARHCKDYYYQIRAANPESRAARAARIIYLNRTCFNGLFRENSKGEFNVPMGSYKNPQICNTANLRAVATALRDADVKTRPFHSVSSHAEPGDLVYFDPPYHPLSDTAGFTAYQKDGFGEKEQRALADVFRELDARGVYVLLSNSWAPLVQELYADFTVEQVFAKRSVNSRGDKRGAVPEALVRNF
ncbi:MAG: DNA adenine methylase [Candidatus Hydrogenedentota bacterium]